MTVVSMQSLCTRCLCRVDAVAMRLLPDSLFQVELLCSIGASQDKEHNVDKHYVDKDAARSFVLTCLRSGVRLDLKPRKSSTGLVAHVRRRLFAPARYEFG